MEIKCGRRGTVCPLKHSSLQFAVNLTPFSVIREAFESSTKNQHVSFSIMPNGVKRHCGQWASTGAQEYCNTFRFYREFCLRSYYSKVLLALTKYKVEKAAASHFFYTSRPSRSFLHSLETRNIKSNTFPVGQRSQALMSSTQSSYQACRKTDVLRVKNRKNQVSFWSARLSSSSWLHGRLTFCVRDYVVTKLFTAYRC